MSDKIKINIKYNKSSTLSLYYFITSLSAKYHCQYKVYHNNLNKPSYITFGNKGNILKYYFDLRNDLHRTNGPAECYIETNEYFYWLNGIRYNKIDYFLKVAEML